VSLSPPAIVGIDKLYFNAVVILGEGDTPMTHAHCI
jgi:hypothetical protein